MMEAIVIDPEDELILSNEPMSLPITTKLFEYNSMEDLSDSDSKKLIDLTNKQVDIIYKKLLPMLETHAQKGYSKARVFVARSTLCKTIYAYDIRVNDLYYVIGDMYVQKQLCKKFKKEQNTQIDFFPAYEKDHKNPRLMKRSGYIILFKWKKDYAKQNLCTIL